MKYKKKLNIISRSQTIDILSVAWPLRTVLIISFLCCFTVSQYFFTFVNIHNILFMKYCYIIKYYFRIVIRNKNTRGDNLRSLSLEYNFYVTNYFFILKC